MSELLLIHVRADAAGTWFVHAGDAQMPVSAHPTETEAEQAAVELAGEIQEECRVVVHDRYARTHDAPDPPTGDGQEGMPTC